MSSRSNVCSDAVDWVRRWAVTYWRADRPNDWDSPKRWRQDLRYAGTVAELRELVIRLRGEPAVRRYQVSTSWELAGEEPQCCLRCGKPYPRAEWDRSRIDSTPMQCRDESCRGHREYDCTRCETYHYEPPPGPACELIIKDSVTNWGRAKAAERARRAGSGARPPRG